MTITANTSGKPVLSWNKVDGATGYEIWRATGTGAYKKLTTTTKLTVTNSAADGTYSYKVRAVKADGAYSDYSNVVTFTIGVPANVPTLTITANASGKPVLSWNKVDGATGYEIWRATGTGAYKKLTTTTKLTVTNSAADGTYSYKVRAVKADGKYSDYSNAVAFTIGASSKVPTVTVKLNTSGKPVISWNSISGATKYEVYRSVNGGAYARLILTGKTSVTHTGAVAGNTYSYRVRTVDANNNYGSYSGIVTVKAK